jgi:hypothetical protein
MIDLTDFLATALTVLAAAIFGAMIWAGNHRH